MEIKLRAEHTQRPKKKSRSKRVSTAIKRCSSTRFSKKIDNLTLETPREYKRKLLNRTYDSTTSRSIKKQENSVKKFQSDYNTLIKLYPEFPAVMMKTLIIRENGNMKSVCKFLKSRGWKQAEDVPMPKFQNDDNLHIKTLHFWGIDNSVYSTILEKKEIGSFISVYSSKSYYIYLKSNEGIKKHAVPSLNISELPIASVLNITTPVNRFTTIKASDLLIFP